MVASDRQVMYWAPDKKTAVALKCLSTHSAVGQSFTIRYCTGRSGAQLIGSHHISASVTKQVCYKCSCPGGLVCCKRNSQSFLWPLHSSVYRLIRYCTGHRVYTLFISSRHISVSVTKQVCCKLLLFFSSSNTFRVTLGLISGFLGKSCRSEKIVTDFQTNMQLGQLGFQPSKHGRQVLLNSVLQENSDFYIKYHTST